MEIASGSVRFGDADKKLTELGISRRGLRLLARRSVVTVTLVAVATRADGSATWNRTRDTMVLEHPRRRRRRRRG